MSVKECDFELNWIGPYSWPGSDLAGVDPSDEIPLTSSGVYIFTVEYDNGYLIYFAGVTRRPFRKRFYEHGRAYQRGIYTVFDIDDFQRGVKNKVWPGFWMGKRSPQMELEFQSRREVITLATERQLSAYRIFVAEVDSAPRLLERIEASIMNSLYASVEPISTIPDRGMMLAPRWDNEPELVVKNVVSLKIHGLPEYLTV